MKGVVYQWECKTWHTELYHKLVSGKCACLPSSLKFRWQTSLHIWYSLHTLNCKVFSSVTARNFMVIYFHKMRNCTRRWLYQIGSRTITCYAASFKKDKCDTYYFRVSSPNSLRRIRRFSLKLERRKNLEPRNCMFKPYSNWRLREPLGRCIIIFFNAGD